MVFIFVRVIGIVKEVIGKKYYSKSFFRCKMIIIRQLLVDEGAKC